MPYGKKSECRPKKRDPYSNLIYLEEVLERVLDEEKKNILLVGASLGGYIALLYSLSNPVKGLALIGPVGLDDTKIKNNVSKMEFPVLIIYGEKDYIISVSEIKDFAMKTPKTKVIKYENAGHPAYLYHRERFAMDLLSFYNDL
jgi:pimeloyl-ACP methyl ester carboxylesterase